VAIRLVQAFNVNYFLHWLKFSKTFSSSPDYYFWRLRSRVAANWTVLRLCNSSHCEKPANGGLSAKFRSGFLTFPDVVDRQWCNSQVIFRHPASVCRFVYGDPVSLPLDPLRNFV